MTEFKRILTDYNSYAYDYSRDHIQKREKRLDHPKFLSLFTDPSSEAIYLHLRLAARTCVLALRSLITVKDFCLLVLRIKKSAEVGKSFRLASSSFWRLHVTPWKQFSLLLFSSFERVFNREKGIQSLTKISRIDLEYDLKELLIANPSLYNKKMQENGNILSSNRENEVPEKESKNSNQFQAKNILNVPKPSGNTNQVNLQTIIPQALVVQAPSLPHTISSPNHAPEVLPLPVPNASSTPSDDAKAYIREGLLNLSEEKLTPEDENTLDTLLAALKEDATLNPDCEKLIIFFIAQITVINQKQFATLRQKLEEKNLSSENINKILTSSIWIDQAILDNHKILKPSMIADILREIEIPAELSEKLSNPSFFSQKIRKEKLVKEIKKLDNYRMDRVQGMLLKKLNFPFSLLDDRHHFYQNKLEILFDDFFDKEDLQKIPSLNLLRTWIHIYTFFERLDDANQYIERNPNSMWKKIPEKNFSYLFQLIISGKKSLKKLDSQKTFWKNHLEKEKENLATYYQDYYSKLFGHHFRLIHTQMLESEFDKVISNFLPRQDIEPKKAEFLQELERMQLALDLDNNPNINTTMTNNSADIKWLEENNKYIKVPFIQDAVRDDEILQDGVCYAICTRLALAMIENPTITNDHLYANRIDRIDRLRQAAHQAQMHCTKYQIKSMNDRIEKLKMPPKVLPKNNLLLECPPLYTQELCFRTDTEDFFSQGLDREAKKIQDDGRGVLIIALRDHAVMMQLHEETKQYRLFDPNFGLLQFSTQAELELSFYSLLQTFYPETDSIITYIFKKNSYTE